MGRVRAIEEGWYQHWFPLLRFVWVGTAATAWYVLPEWGLRAAVLAAVPWVVDAVKSRDVGRGTPFDAPLVVFLATAGVSLAVTYDPEGTRAVFAPAPVGWGKVWGLILAALVFYALASLETDRERWCALRLLSGFGVAVALWFLTTTDWDARSANWAFIPRLGRLVQSILPDMPGHPLNANVPGGLMALTLPMNLELLFGQTRPPRKGFFLLAAWGFASTAVMVLALVLSSSRGAWLGFGGALCLAATWWLAGQIADGPKRIVAFIAMALTGALVGGLVIAASPPLREVTLETEAAANRLRLFSQAALLVRDYTFTGCGLGQFPLVHSTYALLIHVPVLVYAHSTPLAVAVEQGLPAALILLVMWGATAWIGLRVLADSEHTPAGLTTGLLALVVLVIHSGVDNVIYGSRALPLLWFPLGLIVGAERQTARQGRKETNRQRDTGTRRELRRRRWTVVGTVTAALMIGVVFWRPLAAAWQANLGAVHQTLVELRTYDWHHFDDPTLDEIRRREDLSKAVGHFERAVALEPGQATARTRLAQIALARGGYEEGLTHVRAAWEAGHRDRVTRLVLGEALVALGRVDEAASVVRGVEGAEARFDGQAFYRYWVNEDWQRAAYAWTAVLRLDPDNVRVQGAVERAEDMVTRQ